jgi:putative hydrolase of the HAD superfamily
MSNIKAIFCDVNGVLFEQEERFSNRYAQEFGVSIESLNAYLDNDFDLCLTGKADLKIDLQGLLKPWKWQGSVDELLDYWFGQAPRAYPALIEFLNSLENKYIQLFLATQNEKYKTAKFLDLLKPLLRYDHLLATYQVGYKKSNPLYFTTALAQYNLKPEQVVLIDNNPKAIASAESVGMQTIFFTTEAQTISDLKKILMK